MNAPNQAPYKYPPKNGSWDGLTMDQLNEDLVIAYQNEMAWGPHPTGGFQGGSTPGQNERDYEKACYALAGINAARTILYHSQNKGVGQPESMQSVLARAGITVDPHRG